MYAFFSFSLNVKAVQVYLLDVHQWLLDLKNVDIFIEGGCINLKSYITVHCAYKAANIELKINYITRITTKEFSSS